MFYVTFLKMSLPVTSVPGVSLELPWTQFFFDMFMMVPCQRLKGPELHSVCCYRWCQNLGLLKWPVYEICICLSMYLTGDLACHVLKHVLGCKSLGLSFQILLSLVLFMLRSNILKVQLKYITLPFERKLVATN